MYGGGLSAEGCELAPESNGLCDRKRLVVSTATNCFWAHSLAGEFLLFYSSDSDQRYGLLHPLELQSRRSQPYCP